jgi:hypothetical protein
MPPADGLRGEAAARKVTPSGRFDGITGNALIAAGGRILAATTPFANSPR